MPFSTCVWCRSSLFLSFFLFTELYTSYVAVVVAVAAVALFFRRVTVAGKLSSEWISCGKLSRWALFVSDVVSRTTDDVWGGVGDEDGTAVCQHLLSPPPTRTPPHGPEKFVCDSLCTTGERVHFDRLSLLASLSLLFSLVF